MCPRQDLNLHSFRNTHLKRARLPIPPPGHLVEFLFSWNFSVVFFRAQDKTWTCTALRRLPPQSSVSTNSTTWAYYLSKAGAKVLTFFDMDKKKQFFFIHIKPNNCITACTHCHFSHISIQVSRRKTFRMTTKIQKLRSIDTCPPPCIHKIMQGG